MRPNEHETRAIESTKTKEEAEAKRECVYSVGLMAIEFSGGNWDSVAVLCLNAMTNFTSLATD